VLKAYKFKILDLWNWLAYALAYMNKWEILQFLDKMFNSIIHWLIFTQFKAWIFETSFLCVIVLF